MSTNGQEEQTAPVDWQAIAKLRERELKTLGQTALGYQQRAWDAEAELKQAQAALDRVRAAADRLADGTEAGFRAALTIREALADPCKQHPNAPTIAGMCGGCTQYPTDKPATA